MRPRKRKPADSGPGLVGTHWPRPWIFDPIAWAVLLLLFVSCGWDIRWLLLVVPVWIAVRIVLVWRRGKNEGIW